MIIVVADDFTGAAEMAGVGLMHGLKVELDVEGAWPASVDILVIATDTRSKKTDAALEEIKTLSGMIITQQPEWIYKKIDSVLRGHVLEEAKAMVGALHKKGALIIPANPALGRIIKDGKYYIDGKPLDQTSFANSPQYKIVNSSISGLLKRNGSDIDFTLLKPSEFRGEGNLVIGEASNLGDLDFWAENDGSEWLYAGAAGFFQSLLKARGIPVVNDNHTVSLKKNASSLYLCASTFPESRELVATAGETGPYVSYMPAGLFHKQAGYGEDLENWVSSTVSILRKFKKVIVAVREPILPIDGQSDWIKNKFSLLVMKVFERTRIEELIIEGGSTASSVILKLGLTRLVPIEQFQQGVIRMKVGNIPGLHLTLKPGSYTWPDTVWKF